MSAPSTFKCGHERTAANTRVKGDHARCRACYRAWENAHRKKVGRKKSEYQPRRSKLLRDSAAAKPHLYPSQQAA